ncbi:hypothetical protein [Holdemanella biformis]|uniref:Uncharacterized protein n=1 Tax=Holdemanella biformis DSM 3989 TaxID=518637 RepID=B7C7X6_9FIRM|nr:hypothetical protein [Holdemanella biformis]EEC91117.1 hypothetical protein EUBIFOR_00277 [Holdemanella biformis DSM 3989]
MSKNDKNIDAYSKALLDKKTEYNEELKKPKEVHQMTEDERRLAEKTMSSALDMLRKERGQKTIAEEERLYEENKVDSQHMEDDFTTSSIENEQSSDALDLVHTMLQDMSNDDDELLPSQVKKLKEKQEKKEKRKRKKNQRKKKKKSLKKRN